MTQIVIHTSIKASESICFDLARSVDVHISSLSHTKERAIAGRTSGLCELNDIVTWEAKHFGVTQQLVVKITKMDFPYFFEDVMIKGVFKSMQHQHYFQEKNGTTLMKDIFSYETTGWIFGKMFDVLVLNRYMTHLLTERNRILKTMAESI